MQKPATYVNKHADKVHQITYLMQYNEPDFVLNVTQ